MSHFTIKVPCKGYLKAFLENNCGYPADLRQLPDVYKEFVRGLKKNTQRYASFPAFKYHFEIEIIIPNEIFYHYGWEMNHENIRDFNRMVELRLKFFMRSWIGINHALGTPVAVCIREFQDRFGFPEQVWSYEAIKKDYDRNGHKDEIHMIKELKKEIREIFLGQMSEIGTITPRFKKELNYE